MPQSPYAILRASVNSGGNTTGGITVPASATVQLSADPTASVGATQYKYEIYGYPTGFTCPSGWSTDSSGVYFYNSGATPPIFTLPTVANWGKFMLRLTLNNAISTNTKVIPVHQLIDESTALSIVSPSGLQDVGLFETNQFNKTWVQSLQADLRLVSTAVTTGSGATVPVATIIISNVATLSSPPSANDGYTLLNGDAIGLAGQTITSQNGIYTLVSGTLVKNVTQPTNQTLINVTNGSILLNTLWVYNSGSLSQVQGGTTGTLVGASGTVVNFAPDIPSSAKSLIDNPGISVQSIANDASFHNIWAFDFTGRGFTTSGTITVIALVKVLDGSHSCRVRLEAEVFCSSTPSITAASIPDVLDDLSGSGGYLTAQFAVSGSSLVLQVKNNQGSSVKVAGLVGIVVISPT